MRERAQVKVAIPGESGDMLGWVDTPRELEGIPERIEQLGNQGEISG